MTIDLGVTLTFDLLKFIRHLMNAKTLKHVHTKSGKAMFYSFCDTAADGEREGQRDGGTDGGTDGRMTGRGHLPIVVPS